MGDRLGIQVAVDILEFSYTSRQKHYRLITLKHCLYTFSNPADQYSEFFIYQILSFCKIIIYIFFDKNCLAPGEARTHGLQIMRLTRCLLRYGGW